MYWLSIIAVFSIQLTLCHEAFVCRGWPPLTEFGMYKMWASPFLVWIPAIFGTRATRFRGLAVMSFLVGVCFAMISINGMLTPSIGHLRGAMGLFASNFVSIIFTSLVWSPFVFGILYFVERVFGDIWRAVWFLNTEQMTFAETWGAAWHIRVVSQPENA